MTNLSPPMKRGTLYNTALWERCHDYHCCRRCMSCAHYNPHRAECLVCESAKPRGFECHCSDESQAAMIRMEENSGRPLFDVNGAMGQNVTVDRGSVCFNNEQANLVKNIQEG